MSPQAACGWSLLRSLVVATLAVSLSIWLVRRLPRFGTMSSRVAWGLLAAPFLFPALLSGYAFSSAGLQLAGFLASLAPLLGSLAADLSRYAADHHEAIDELLLDLLLFVRAVPVGTILLACAPPPPVSPTAIHARHLAHTPGAGRMGRWLSGLRLLGAGPARNILAAAALTFLLAFQEFELPSLLSRPAWPVWLFDAQVGGLALSESLRATLLPVLCQIGSIGLLLWGIGSSFGTAPAQQFREEPVHASRGEFCYLVAAMLLACVVPFALIGRDVTTGFQALAGNKSQLERILSGTAWGAGFALISAAIVSFLTTYCLPRPMPRLLLLAACLPGFCGPLVLGLGLVRLLQSAPIDLGYKTPLSLFIGQVLFLLPRGVLLQCVWQATRPETARHLGWLLGEAAEQHRRSAAHELRWQLGQRAQFWTLGLLTSWGYLELTISYLLGPRGIESLPVFLYNQMHFGKNAILAATTCLAVLMPALMFLIAAALRPILFRWFWR